MKHLANILFVVGVAAWMIGAAPAENPKPAPIPSAPTTTTTASTATTTTATTTTEAPRAFYPLTDEEREIVERVVMAESGAEPFEGQLAVAQCILNASAMYDIRPSETVVHMGYTPARPDPTDEVKQAVAAVFDEGRQVFGADVLYFYAPALCESAWHESQEYVTTIGGHRFFKEAD